MAMADLEGTIIAANPALEIILDEPARSLVGSRWLDYVAPSDRGEQQAAVESLAAGREDVYRPDTPHRFIRHDGTVVWGQISLAAIRGGTPALIFCHLQDVTATRSYQERLEDVIRSKDEFVASVSHELRTPMAVIMGLSHELRDGLSGFGEQETTEFVGLIASQSVEVANIVDDLLVAARADIGRVTVQPAGIDVTAEAQRIAWETRSTAPIVVSQHPAPAWADAHRVRQILRNLVSNAVRYGGDHIEIITGVSGPQTYALVKDDGPGISEAERELIFAPYYRTHNVPGQPASVGLGLTVSRKLAELMGGSLEYRKTPDDSSTFELRLPAAPRGSEH
jgi:PAS domain S-box-containing protein